MLTRHKHTTSAWRNTHTPHTRAPTAPRLTIQTENTTSITSPTQTHNILQHSNAKKNTIFNNDRYTTNILTDPHTVTTTDIKTNMRHIHTSIVPRHLATRGNNKILRTHPPHTSSSEEILPRLTRRTLAQLRTNNLPSSNHTYTKSTPKHIHHHYVTFTHTTHIISSTAPTYAPHCRPWICGQTPPEWLHCWPDGRRSWLVDRKREHRTPPTSKGHGSG